MISISCQFLIWWYEKVDLIKGYACLKCQIKVINDASWSRQFKGQDWGAGFPCPDKSIHELLRQIFTSTSIQRIVWNEWHASMQRSNKSATSAV